MSGFDQPVMAGDKTAHWKRCHPYDENRLCDGCRRIVGGRESRLWVEDPAGNATKQGHGHPRRYYCVECAFVHFELTEPPSYGFGPLPGGDAA